MISSTHRISKELIKKHLVQAKRLRTKHFLVMCALLKGQKGPKIGITAPKKIAPTAVERNYLRRRGYSAINPLIPDISPDVCMLISYTAKTPSVKISELTTELKEACIQANLLK